MIFQKTASQIDKLIQCELPDPAKEKEYYDLVVTHQIHGPCLLGDPRCWKHGKCSKGFPKKYQEQTVFIADGYPSYRRRNQGITFKKGGKEYGNEW
ncbi:MAG: hypothetical protein EZS28_054240, partial [Streblomastix strix]